MRVCLVTGGKSHYSGLCIFGAQDVKATILAYVGLRVNALSPLLISNCVT